MAGYTYLNPLIDPHLPHAGDWQKLATALCVALVILLLGRKATRNIGSVSQIDSAVVPADKAGLFGVFDIFIEFFVKFHDSVMGKEGRKYVPFTGSLFLFILLSNLFGLVPGMPAITTTVWINVGLAIAVFVFFNAMGVRENGVIGYLKHFCGPVIFLAPFLFPLEIFSTVLRVLTLNLRLYWNITADHMVVGIFTDLLGPLFPVPLYVLGTFVCFMQAFIFTTLTMVYILLATQHEHGEEH
jgi:F-type H+-transporting ATPase subunit a